MKLRGVGLSCLLACGLAAPLPAAPPVDLKPGRTRTRSTHRTGPIPPTNATPSANFSTADLARNARNSLVVLATRGRDGVGEGVGTGFVIDPSGLIATSLHVVGESRPVVARLLDGREIPILAIHAFDRHADLAILRVDATNLASLNLGDSSALQVGAEVVALGNPLGLENSVVAGVLSGRRTLEEVEMLQVAIPIEPGNSGGPLLDRSGHVQGIVNSKSLLTRNLGFATPINLLKPLLEQPNPVPFDRWLRIGSLDPTQWEPHLGARWRQRAGRIAVEGTGTGFGGRAFILHRTEAPTNTYEVSVQVRLGNGSGAAGLVFGGLPDDRHYGFYPTSGQLRLTAFEGADVFSWRILGTVPNTAYRPDDWNLLRIRHEAGRIQCWVNDAPVFSMAEAAFDGRKVGLVKFRDTVAEFRDFRVADSSTNAPGLDPALIMALGGPSVPTATVGPEDTSLLRTNLSAARAFIASRARSLDLEAARLRELSLHLHRDSVRDELVTELAQPEAQIDLARAALLVARLDNPDLDVPAYRQQLRGLAAEIRNRLTEAMPASERVDRLRQFLFEENGFHGSRHDYYSRANSYLNDVLDDREGLPITLSLVFLVLAHDAGIEHVRGVPLPGHFLVKHAPPDADERLIDVYNGGRYLTHSEADELGASHAGVPVRSELLRPATKREMLVRLVTNLQAFTERESGAAASLHYADLLVVLAAEPRAEAAQRVDRARLRAQSGDPAGASADLRWILESAPEGMDAERIAEMIRRLNP
jgi:serine protease Do